MAAKSPQRRRLSAAVAAIERHNGPHDSRIEPLRRELEVESLAEHIRRVVDAAPPLTAEHAAYLRDLLPLPAGVVA